MKKGLFLLLVGFWLAGHADLQAQSIYGTWVNQQYGISMTLHASGRFDFTGPQGSSQGQWGVQGQIFMMQDATGQIIQYQITGFDATRLQLMDAYGVALHYTKKSDAAGSGKVLATSGGYQLLESHIQTGVGIIEFVVGQSIKKKEVESLTQTSITEFTAEPAFFIQQVNGLQQSLDRLRTLTDAVQIGMGRQMLVAAFHKATRNMPAESVPLMIQIINRYVKVLAFDERNELVLTENDVSAMLDYMIFTQQQMGVQRRFSRQEKAQFQKDLINQFAGMDLNSKQFLCSAGFLWNLVKANYQRMSAQQQQQFQTSYTDQSAAGYQWQNDQDFQAFNRMPKSQQQQKLREMQRNSMANQNLYNMMNNMSLQHHATMLNTIENFGGTGNYWEVTNTQY